MEQIIITNPTYRKKFKKILINVHRLLSNENYDFNPKEFFAVQNKIAKNIMELENTIRNNEKEIKELSENLKHFHKQKNIEVIKIYQTLIQNGKRIEEIIKYEIKAFRLLGDTLAWVFFRPFEIRKDCELQEPGSFISEKQGFKYEMNFADLGSKLENIENYVIVHELTNCLRMGDLTFIYGKDNNWQRKTFELKSFENPTEKSVKAAIKKSLKQAEKSETIEKYLKGEKILQDEFLKTFPNAKTMPNAENIYLRLKTDKNNSSNVKEHYFSELTSEIKRVIKTKKNSFVSYDGIIAYYIAHSDNLHKENLEFKPKLVDFAVGTTTIMRNALRDKILYYPQVIPLTLELEPEIATELFMGDIHLYIYLNDVKLSDYLKEHGFNAEINNDLNMHYLKDGIKLDSIGRINIQHPLLYLFYAFRKPLYLVNFVKDLANKMTEFQKEYQ